MNPAGRIMNKFYPGIKNVISALQEELLFVVSEDHKNSALVISQPVYLTGEYMCGRRTRIWVQTQTRILVLNRNREQGSESESVQCEHVMHSTM